MDADEIREEIAHNKALIKEYKKSLRVLELQAAKFGLHVPPYIQIEIDEIRERVQSFEQSVLKYDTSQSVQNDIEDQVIDVRDRIDSLRQEIEIEFIRNIIKQKTYELNEYKERMNVLQKSIDDPSELNRYIKQKFEGQGPLGFSVPDRIMSIAAMAPALLLSLGIIGVGVKWFRTKGYRSEYQKEIEKAIIATKTLIDYTEKEIEKLNSQIQIAET